MKSMKLGVKVLVISFFLGLLALIGWVVVDLSSYMEKSNKEQMAEFVANVQTVGFIVDPAVWAEDGKPLENPRLDQGDIRLNVLVNGCSLELTRSIGARETKTMNGHEIKRFQASRVFLTKNGQQGATKVYQTQYFPTPDQVSMTLADNKSIFSCYQP